MSAQTDRVARMLEFLTAPPSEPMPNARRFINDRFTHSERALLVHQGGLFYAWDGTCWPALDDQALRSQLYQYFEHALYIDAKGNRKPFAPNRSKVTNLLDALRGVSEVAVSTPTPSWLGNGELPADEMVVCRNGLVHYPTRVLRPHTPSYYGHYSVPFEFDAQAPPPARWLAFLRDLWSGDAESIETLQEIFGYLVCGETRQQKMFLIVGPKRSGKGTIARVVNAILGKHNVASPTLASLGTNFGLSPLIGRPVAIISDARLKASDTSVVTERLLSISGEDTLTVDRKYREPWTGQLSSRVVILSNELPRVTDSSGALASRFIVLTMTETFYGRENLDLTAELCSELPGIFNWALDGLERLRDRGRFRQPAASQDAIRELEDLGSPVGAFIRDECVIGPEYWIPCDTLYEAWRSWCEEHGRRASSAQIFGRDLRAAYPSTKVVQPRSVDGSRYRAYQGLARNGTRTSLLYAQHDDRRAQQHIGEARVPPRANVVRCVSCVWLDPSDGRCYHEQVDRPIPDPDRDRECPYFRVPI
jgi:putative DNA primase/helicase